ncbi:hypothetical protein ACJIZ3_013431 [Penstemon smallii]|uniref:Uncharacterized protein n=1 Tax=Penstemon smallii TaxID=265156 RepID=A0ABD3UPW3_9LAMI
MKQKRLRIEGIEHEISSLRIEETKLVAEIKKSAKTGNEASCHQNSGSPISSAAATDYKLARESCPAPKGKIASKKAENVASPPSSAASNDVEDLDKMLASLRRR